MGFQSPCAGNMFGKDVDSMLGKPSLWRDKFQSPCAGNMFGKIFVAMFTFILGVFFVSIPVCGEHVW